jgi:hypothetical protein
MAWGGGGTGGFGDFGGSVGGSVGTASGTSGMTGASSNGGGYGSGSGSSGKGGSSGGNTGNGSFSDFGGSVGGGTNSGNGGTSGMTGGSSVGGATGTGESWGGGNDSGRGGFASELDSLAFDASPISGPGYGLSPASLTSGFLSAHEALYDAPPLDGRTGAGARGVQTSPQIGIEVNTGSLRDLGALQNKENPGFVAEANSVIERAKADRGYMGGANLQNVMNQKWAYEPVTRAGKGNVANLPSSPLDEQRIAAALNGVNPAPNMTHFFNPEVVAARDRAGLISANTREWTGRANANPDKTLSGAHTLANPDRVNNPTNISPVVTAGIEAFSPNAVPGTQFSLSAPAPAAQRDQNTPVAVATVATIDIDKYLGTPGTAPGGPAPQAPSAAIGYASQTPTGPAPGSQIDFASIFANNPQAPIPGGSLENFGRPGRSEPTDVYSSSGPRSAETYASAPPAAPAPAPADPAPARSGVPDPTVAPGLMGALNVPAAPNITEAAARPAPREDIEQALQLNKISLEPDRLVSKGVVNLVGGNVGAFIGGTIGTAFGGLLGGLAGSLLGGWAGGKLGEGSPNQEAWGAADGEGVVQEDRNEEEPAPKSTIDKYLMPVHAATDFSAKRQSPAARFQQGRPTFQG